MREEVFVKKLLPLSFSLVESEKKYQKGSLCMEKKINVSLIMGLNVLSILSFHSILLVLVFWCPFVMEFLIAPLT